LNLNPKADDFYTDRGGGAYLRKDHYDHAIKDYDEELKINPKSLTQKLLAVGVRG
jgi:tetratricopeptide (TPR) repeat protein